MDIIEITYCFHLEDKKRETFKLRLDAGSLELISDNGAPVPEWAALEYHQCSNCTHNREETPYCLVAKNLASVISRFDAICSHEKIDLEVITDERRIIQNTTAQRAISSLLGLIFATSGCSHTAYMKPMARFHLPLASHEETTFRAAGMFLLAQYFQEKAGQGGKFDMAGLKDIYQALHVINIAISDRIRSALSAEASINAVVILDTRANLIPFSIEEQFDEIRHLFDAYDSEGIDENRR